MHYMFHIVYCLEFCYSVYLCFWENAQIVTCTFRGRNVVYRMRICVVWWLGTCTSTCSSGTLQLEVTIEFLELSRL